MGPVITSVLLVLVLVLIGLLLAPIDIYLDTRSNQYYAEIKGLLKARVESDQLEMFRIRLQVPFKHFDFYPLKYRPKKIGKKQKEHKGGKHRNRFTPKTIIRLARSFEIREWNLDLDTGDCITNAKLYPLFSFMDYRYGGFHINFEGRNRVKLWVRNRPLYLIKSFFNL